MLPDDKAGSITLYGSEPVMHSAWARGVMAEEWITEYITGKGDRSRWKVNSKHNHPLDVTALLKVAADMLGLRVFAGAAATSPPKPKGRRIGKVGSKIRTKY